MSTCSMNNNFIKMNKCANKEVILDDNEQTTVTSEELNQLTNKWNISITVPDKRKKPKT